MKKPISPSAHGIIDYGLIAALFAAPEILEMNPKAKTIYRLMGSTLGVYNALTDNGVSIKPLIPFRTHCKVDYLNLASVALIGRNKNIRKHKNTSLFHALFLSTAVLTVLLTDVPKKRPD